MTVCQGNRALNLAPSELFFHGYFKVLYASSFYTRGLARRPPRVRRNPPSPSTPPHLRARLRSAGTCGWQAFQWRAGPGIRGFDKAEAVETYLYAHPPTHPPTHPATYPLLRLGTRPRRIALAGVSFYGASRPPPRSCRRRATAPLGATAPAPTAPQAPAAKRRRDVEVTLTFGLLLWSPAR